MLRAVAAFRSTLGAPTAWRSAAPRALLSSGAGDGSDSGSKPPDGKPKPNTGDASSKPDRASVEIKPEDVSDVASDSSAASASASAAKGSRFSSTRRRPSAAAADAGSQSSASNSSSANGVIATRSHVVPPYLLALPMYRRPLFPGFATTIVVANEKLVRELDRIKSEHRTIGLFLIKDPDIRDSMAPVVDISRLHDVGVAAEIRSLAPQNSGSTLVTVEGICRIEAAGAYSSSLTDPELLYVNAKRLFNKPLEDRDAGLMRALTADIYSTLRDLISLSPIHKENLTILSDQANLYEPSSLADMAGALTLSPASDLQKLLETTDLPERLQTALFMLKTELDSSRLQQKISKQLEEKISQTQRKYFLNEQLKAIRRELGVERDEKESLLQKFRDRISKLVLPKHAQSVIDDEMAKLQAIEQNSMEFSVCRNYLEWLTNLPWGVIGKENYSLSHAQKVLNEDHYGLETVKDRILELIAVGGLKGQMLGKIICLVGPPGVGKTSIGKSIARATDREFFRFSVGGMSDVAEIKGHRRTYVGAMPGKVLQALKLAKTSNPVLMIDEIDKISKSWHGDPSSALLEVLDPSQNGTFLDHYLDVSFDLSKILFVVTANTTDSIPPPLLDRMEVIRVAGYISEEKLEIASKYLIPASLKEHGLSPNKCAITPKALLRLINEYCRESGVRNLQKHIEKLHRKAAMALVMEQEAAKRGKNRSETADFLENASQSSKKLREVVVGGKVMINGTNLDEFLGKPTFPGEVSFKVLPPGVVTGLAWNSLGGTHLFIETVGQPEAHSEKQGMRITGQMGDVMKESTSIAFTVAKIFLAKLDAKNDFFKNHSVHMHIPEGATPKDGPSAGIAMVTALISLASGLSISPKLAMTGEVTLTGRVLPIGGVREKIIAAKRAGVTTVILPDKNKRDFDELPDHVKSDITAHFVSLYNEVYDIVFPSQAETSKKSK
eukprot:TRINITY_DN12712_c0_g1_i1.p1 TRINITY_DN12712_c0_g1~~TRINITY_DN12712_c0_g1_i1.p1  ORF type:complete len:954 (-),score=226.35 TRINITY_DN12712_c0_g1_i1:22-2883(-)